MKRFLACLPLLALAAWATNDRDIATAVRDVYKVQDFDGLEKSPAWRELGRACLGTGIRDNGQAGPSRIAFTCSAADGTDAGQMRTRMDSLTKAVESALPSWTFKDSSPATKTARTVSGVSSARDASITITYEYDADMKSGDVTIDGHRTAPGKASL
jgi:hypothetical protein